MSYIKHTRHIFKLRLLFPEKKKNEKLCKPVAGPYVTSGKIKKKKLTVFYGVWLQNFFPFQIPKLLDNLALLQLDPTVGKANKPGSIGCTDTYELCIKSSNSITMQLTIKYHFICVLVSYIGYQNQIKKNVFLPLSC